MEILGRPFASQSFLGLIVGLFAGLVAIGLVVGSFGTAFGEGEDRREFDRRKAAEIRAEAEAALRVQQEALAEKLTKEAQKARRG